MRVFVTAEDIRLLDRHTELAIRDADHDGHALGTEVFGSHAHRFHALTLLQWRQRARSRAARGKGHGSFCSR